MKPSVLALCVVYLALILGTVGCAFSCKNTNSLLPHPVPPPVAAQRKFAHSLVFLDPRGRDVSQCSSVAIGPHALLTAQHCNPSGELLGLHIDLATHTYRIVQGYVDDRDHLIIIVDGPPFVNISPVVQRSAVSGEHVFMFGFGGGDYPPHRVDGRVIADVGGDDSDVDARARTTSYSLEVIPGDSGAAVYGDDGAIIGLITYAREARNKVYSTGFELNFGEDILSLVAQ